MSGRLWTPEEDAVLRAMAAEKLSASSIGAKMGRSRNSIIGRAHRLKVKLDGRPVKIIGERPVGSKPRQPKPRRDDNVIKLRIPAKPVGPNHVMPIKTVEVQRGPRLSVITNERRLIEDFIAKNGVRRFAMGDRCDMDTVKRFLEDRGYTLNGWQGKHKVAHGKGRPRVMSWSQVVGLVDKLRAAEGLPTIRRAG